MDGRYIVYGSPGSGSVPVEAALTLIGAPYEVIGETVLRDVARNSAVFKVNPLGQVPALVIPGGEVDDRKCGHSDLAGRSISRCGFGATAQRREASSVPTVDGLRLLGDLRARLGARRSMRLISDERQVEVVLDRIADRRADCWRWMDAQIEPRRYLLGDELSVLDLYVATISRWSPRRTRFYREAPKMAAIVRRVDTDPRLAELWGTRFPFHEGWEG
jgi:GST-like protein